MLNMREVTHLINLWHFIHRREKKKGKVEKRQSKIPSPSKPGNILFNFVLLFFCCFLCIYIFFSFWLLLLSFGSSLFTVCVFFFCWINLFIFRVIRLQPITLYYLSIWEYVFIFLDLYAKTRLYYVNYFVTVSYTYNA